MADVGHDRVVFGVHSVVTVTVTVSESPGASACVLLGPAFLSSIRRDAASRVDGDQSFPDGLVTIESSESGE